MSAFTAADCRIRQVFFRAGRRMRPAGAQVREEGRGALNAIPQLIRANRLGKPLLVLGEDTAPWDDALRQILEEGDIPFAVSPVPAAPTAADAEALALAYAGESCGSFIALGGAEVIDLAKAAASRAVSEKAILDMAGYRKVGRRTPPVIAIPTAAGSGAEALGWAYVTDKDGNRFRIEDPALTPAFAIYDPALTADTPRQTAARSVMEGVCLAAEAYVSRYADEAAKAAAVGALRGFFEAAEPCWNNGGTLSQRSALLEASRLAGTAASTAGAGYARAICDAAGTIAGLPFEAVCASALPAVLERYGGAASSALSELARRTGLSADGTKAKNAEALTARLRSLAFRLGLPETTGPLSPEDISAIAALAAADANPRWACPAVWTAEDCERVLRSVCGK